MAFYYNDEEADPFNAWVLLRDTLAPYLLVVEYILRRAIPDNIHGLQSVHMWVLHHIHLQMTLPCSHVTIQMHKPYSLLWNRRLCLSV